MAIQAKNKKNRKLLWGLLGLVAVLIVAAILVRNSRPKGEKVTAEKVELRTITETVSASGKVFPETEVNISSDVSGEIVELYVEEGDSIEKGQILLRIDPDSYESAVERGAASVNNSKAQWANSLSGIKSSEAGIIQAEAKIRQVEARLQNSQNIHERNIKLLEQGVISQADFDSSLSNLKSAEADLASEKANLNSAKASVESARQTANASQFSVKSAEASLKELQTSLRRTTIYAPMSGIVSSLSMELGERVVGTIQMTGTEIMRIANLDLMEVQVDVSENDVLRVTLNDDVDIEIDAYLDKKFTGKVSQIANSATGSGNATSLSTDQVTNFIVKILIDRNSYQDLVIPGKPFPFRPGMSASVDIKTNVASEVISAPIQAVASRTPEKAKSSDDKDNAEAQTVSEKNKEEEDQEVVFIVNGNKAKMVVVTTGIQDDEYIQILSGLSEGDQLISGPYAAVARKLEDDKLIQVVDEDKLFSSEN